MINIYYFLLTDLCQRLLNMYRINVRGVSQNDELRIEINQFLQEKNQEWREYVNVSMLKWKQKNNKYKIIYVFSFVAPEQWASFQFTTYDLIMELTETCSRYM